MTAKTAIKVYCSTDEKKTLIRLAEEYNISLSQLLLKSVTGIKLISKHDVQYIKEISKAATIVGKYSGMLKIHLNRYELQDFTQKEIMKEFKEARKARQELLDLAKEMMLGKNS